MPTFKAGDRVYCLDAKNAPHGVAQGSIYTVEGSHGLWPDFILLAEAGTSRTGYLPNRFRLAGVGEIAAFEALKPAAEPAAAPTKAAGEDPLATQVAGDHYKGCNIQPVEYVHANGLNFCEGSVVKYVTRWRKKGGVADLKKARHFLDILIELETRADRAA